MDSEQRDFKAVKVQVKSSQKSGETLSRSMLYSGINIFGQLSQLYLQNKESGGSYSAIASGFKASGQMDAGEGSDAGSMMHLSQEVLSIFKRLQKKDSTTKIKAFAELDKYLEGIDLSQMSTQDQDSDEIQSLLTFFLYHFCRIIMNEPDKKVREAAHQSFSLFIKKAKRRLGPHLKKIFSLWYCSFFDVSPEVALIARKNFETAFPEKNRSQVFKISFKNFLHFANEQLKQSEESISESADLSKAQREDVFDRITSSVFQALAQSFGFIKDWPEEEKEHFKKKMIDYLDLSAQIPDQKSEKEEKKGGKKQQPQSYLWGFLQPSYRGRVRSSCLQFISNLLLNLPQEIIQYHLNQLSPLVYNLIGEDNSSLQITLWKEALFTLGKNFPQSWETINIKKNFLPKLNQTLKNAGYGAPTALYENYVRFVSIFPLYHLVDYVEDKQNKASFKERCNLMRESLTTLYQGLKMDEAVAFHQDLVKCYYETFTFLLWKRVQPLIFKEGISEEDKDFALDQMKKCIQVPADDFILNYEKFQSKAQNQRNIRVMIPIFLAKMFKDLADRDIDQRIYENVVNYLQESLQLTLDKQNSIRLIAALIKSDQKKDTVYYQKVLMEGVILNYTQSLIKKIGDEIGNLNKEVIDSVNKKSQNLLRLLYKMNKYQAQISENALDIKQLISLYFSVIKKEDLAKNVLSQEILGKFKSLKETLQRIIILALNIQRSDEIQDFVSNVLNTFNIETQLRNRILLPQQDFKKLNLDNYFSSLKEKCHEVIMNFLLRKVIEDDSTISQNYSLIDSGITLVQQKSQSFVDESDLKVISSSVNVKINDSKLDIQTLTYYYQSIKSLLSITDEENYEQLKHNLFDKLLTIRSRNPSYNQLWSLFEQTLRIHIQKKQRGSSFFQYCLSKLKLELNNIIHQNTNYDLESFNRFTQIVKSFVQLCDNKQEIVEEILLQEENFNNLENNSLPLKMFKDLFLSGGVGFDVTKLFSSGSKYVWLAAALLNTRHLSSLANFIQLKKQYLVFVETEVLPSLIYQTQNGNEKLILEIFDYIGEKTKENSDYIYTMEYLLQKVIDPGEDFPADEKPILKVDEFKHIFFSTNQKVIDSLLKDEQLEYNNEVLTFIKTIKQTAYFIIDEKLTKDMFAKSTDILRSYLDSQKTDFNEQFGLALEVFQCLLEFFKDTSSVELSDKLLLLMLKNSTKLTEDSNVLNAFLQFVAHSLNTLGFSKFKTLIQDQLDFQSFISSMIEVQSQKHLQPLTYIYLLSIIRKTLASELIKEKQMLISQVIEIAKEHAIAFEIKLQKIQDNLAKELTQQEEIKEDEQEDEDQIENFEYEMLQDLAETLLIFPSYIKADIEENDLYLLISSGIESLQKAAFVLLKYLYENFIPTIKFHFDDSDFYKQLKTDQENQEVQTEEEESKHQEAKQRYKNKLAFKNISEILIELLETPPNVQADAQDQQSLIAGTTESIIFGDHREGSINTKVFGYMLAWNALLLKMEQGRIKAQLQQNEDYQNVLGALNEYLEENYEIYQMLLVSLIAYIPVEKKGLSDSFNLSSFEAEYVDLQDQKQTVLFALYTLINFMKSFPSLARKYYQECDKQLLDIMLPYIRQIVSPAILDHEINKIEVAQSTIGSQELSFVLYKSTKEIQATYQKDEIQMTLKIQIPNDYPLKTVEVEVSKSIKLNEKQMRKWILSIRKILQFQNGDIISAVLSWKANIEKETEGIENCFICYAVVHEGDQSLPKMPCKTCKNKFHVACIRKWFTTSHKSNCPLCQNYFF